MKNILSSYPYLIREQTSFNRKDHASLAICNSKRNFIISQTQREQLIGESAAKCYKMDILIINLAPINSVKFL